MPLTFWGPDGDRRYHDAYFGEYPGIWTHGDLATKTVDGGVVIHGRTDTTLKPGGVRIGTGELYRVTDQISEISDCVVIGYTHDGDEEIVLCVVPATGVSGGRRTGLTHPLVDPLRHFSAARATPHLRGRPDSLHTK